MFWFKLATNALAAAAGITVVIFIHLSLAVKHRLINDRFNADHDFVEQCLHCLVDVLTRRSTCLKERHAATKQQNKRFDHIHINDTR